MLRNSACARFFFGAVLLFSLLFQTLSCHAEQAGFWKCGLEHAEDSSCCATKANDAASSKAPAACPYAHVHCHCSIALPQQQVPHLIAKYFIQDACLQVDEHCPDGPIQAIEHPPQLS